MRRSIVSAALSLAFLATAFGAASASASPASGPAVSFTIPATGLAGHGLSYTYSAAHVPAGDKVVLQRAARGTAHWVTTRTLASGNGKGKTAGQALGRYSWRVAVLHLSHVVTARTENTNVFGTIGLSALCSDRGPQTACGHNLGSATLGGKSFHYVLRTPLSKATVTVLSLPSTSCTSYALNYGIPLAPNSLSPENEIAFLTLRQAHGPTARSEEAALGVLAFSGELKGDGALTMTMEGNYNVGDSMTMNGSLTCDTPNGR